MKKFLLYGIPLLLIVGVGGYFGARWKADFDDPHYGISEQLNAPKTGSAINWGLGNKEEDYLFVRDFKKPSAKPQFLCYMNYTATQGSYHAYWSKDGSMIAVYDESALHFPELKFPLWVIGYDWQRGRVLHSQEIASAFVHHGGQGTECETTTSRSPTAQEIEQFEAEKLNPGRAMP